VLSLAFVVAGMPACAAAPEAQAASSTQASSRQNVEQVIRRHYTSGLPYAEIKRLGPGAFATLQRMLRDPAEQDYWPNAAGAIGIVGGPAAAEVLIGFIDGSRGQALEPAAYRAALTAVVALGYVANAGDSEAMDFLARVVRDGADPAAPPADLRLTPSVVATQAILGLGLSGRREARAALQELARGKDPSARERAQEALKTLEAVRRVGLATYLERR
jgi:hypothetical protein